MPVKPKPLPQKSVPEIIMERMPFDENTLAAAIQDQASLYTTAARYRVGCLRLRNNAEIELKRVRADAALRLRQTEYGKKPTENMFRYMLDRDEKVLAAEEKLARAEELKEWSYHLLEAVGGRRESLRCYVALLIPGTVDMTVRAKR